MRLSAVMLIIGLMFGCSKSNENAPTLNPVTGKHPAGWVVANTGGLHPAAYYRGPSGCLECHGKNMNGGISGVSCFNASLHGINCHPNGPVGHPQGWSAPNSHGAAAKSEFAGRFGFLHCSYCHGANYTGGPGANNKSCFNSSGCHVSSPHPSPWSATSSIFTHTNTDASNASACLACHANGKNSPLGPPPTPPAGTQAGCFNNTLCHAIYGHSSNSNWLIPTVHGAAAKGVASGDTGFKSCTQCHGPNYDGILNGAPSGASNCLNTATCHSAAAPHPPKPWRTTGGVTHTTTDTSNSDQCAKCHTGGQNSTVKPIPGAPAGITGCYNNTLCHGQIGHAPGWSDPAVHGTTAKSAPSQSSGFSSCQLCHGISFVNGNATTCFKGIGCHGFGIAAPHPHKPWFSRTGGLSHTTTDAGNVGVCAICHTAGANSTIKPPFPQTNTLAGCFNNTLCHFHQIPYAPSATIPISLHSGEAKKDLSICQACHGVKGTPFFDGVILADGTRTIACSSCHIYAKAHPTDWQGLGTYSHRDAGNKSVACAICHGLSAGAPSPLPAAPSCFSTTFTNPLGQARACHPNGPGNAAHTVPYINHNTAGSTNLTFCLGCHNITGTGPNPASPACTSCHITSPQANPGNCISCHVKPPNGTTYPNIANSHPSHNALNVIDMCAECHSALGQGTSDHYSRAKLRSPALQPNPVVFGALAKTGGLNPTFITGTCTSTYCHGATLVGGTNKTPSWGQTNYLQGCGTCHGFPPANSAHTSVLSSTPCIGCHPHVNATNNGFTDQTKHINGKIDASGSSHAFPFSGALHRTLGATHASCSGCHDITSPGGSYPVTAGIKPLCSACHLNMTNFTGATPGCWDCHGPSATDGRPSGTSFPNRAGGGDGHNRDTHRVACTICHTITTGSITHGWSNRTKSTAAQMKTTLNWNPGTRASGQGSCNPSAGGITGCHSTETGWY